MRHATAVGKVARLGDQTLAPAEGRKDGEIMQTPDRLNWIEKARAPDKTSDSNDF